MRLMGLSDDSLIIIRRKSIGAGSARESSTGSAPRVSDGQALEGSAPGSHQKQTKAHYADGLAGKLGQLRHVSAEVDMDFPMP